MILSQALGILDRARNLGIQPNTTMYNTAMSALATSGRVAEAEVLFQEMPSKDTVTHETLISAYGLTGEAQKAERALRLMIDSGFVPRDYAYCGLIQAYR
jgi:pentatricopeptide repeat protein